MKRADIFTSADFQIIADNIKKFHIADFQPNSAETFFASPTVNRLGNRQLNPPEIIHDVVSVTLCDKVSYQNRWEKNTYVKKYLCEPMRIILTLLILPDYKESQKNKSTRKSKISSEYS